MNVAELQLELHLAIDSITDEKKLEAIYQLLKGSKGPFTPMSIDQYAQAIDDARIEIKKGQFLDVGDLENESSKW